MERLQRLREPATVLVLVALGLHLGTTLIARAFAATPLDPAPSGLLVLLGALVVGCWAGAATPHARGLTVAALALTAVALAVTVAFVVDGLLSAPVAGGAVPAVLVAALPSLTAGIVALGAAITLLRRPGATSATVPELAPADADSEPVDPQQQPAWTPDAAVGTVWRRAGDAGSETPATSWDPAAQRGGWWGADPDPDTPAEPTRRSTE